LGGGKGFFNLWDMWKFSEVRPVEADEPVFVGEAERGDFRPSAGAEG